MISQRGGNSSPTPMFLERVVAEIFQLPEPTRRDYARALIASLGQYAANGQETSQVLPESPSEVPSVSQIARDYGINVEDQDSYSIILRKGNALTFLKEQGRVAVKPRNDLKSSQYNKAFQGRAVVKVGTSLVFTYAEVLFITGHRRFVFLPRELTEYLNPPSK